MQRTLLSLKIVLLIGFVWLSHEFAGGYKPGRYDSALAAEWNLFKQKYNVDSFGGDGYFVRGVRHGFGLVNKTYDFAWRFTRKTATDKPNSCGSCHTPEDLAYAFVSSDRFDPDLRKRVSFEERVTRCYVKYLDGFVPTIYDPAIRDIRIYARMVANSLELTEGSLRKGDAP